ncbi:MAG TPA: hypothetical protein VFZ26_04150 [Gemmatimonadales bacterium]
MAVLQGQVDPRGEFTLAWFEWGTDPELTGFASTPEQTVGFGTTSVAVSAAIAGLTPGVTYYYRAAAESSGGTARAGPLSFTTAAAVRAAP